MGLIGKIVKIGIAGLCLCGIYQCNHMMTGAREKREETVLESKLENNLQDNKVQDLGYEVIYESESRLQDSHTAYGKNNINYGGIKNDTTTLCN